jgi:hypothetical protein
MFQIVWDEERAEYYTHVYTELLQHGSEDFW